MMQPEKCLLRSCRQHGDSRVTWNVIILTPAFSAYLLPRFQMVKMIKIKDRRQRNGGVLEAVWWIGAL